MNNLTAFYGTTSFALLILLIFTGWFAKEQIDRLDEVEKLRALETAVYKDIENKYKNSLDSINNYYYLVPKSKQYRYDR